MHAELAKMMMESEPMRQLEQKLLHLPSEPGVYLYKNAQGKIIYVGKAKSLKNRVRSYFQQSRQEGYKLGHLLAEVADVETIVVDSEMEALALENNLIKQHKPKFNILLRDDKTFPCLKLAINETYPRLSVTRKVVRDGALYFGPYIFASLARQTLNLACRHFQIRTCTLPINGRRPRPCLDYHIHRCLAPCVSALCSADDYAERIRQFRLFMEGERKTLARELEAKMQAASAEEQYEQAAHYRDMLQLIEQLAESQKISSQQTVDLDLFALCQEGTKAVVELFHLRHGRVVDRREFFWEEIEENTPPGEILAALVKQFYLTAEFTPDEVHVSHAFEDMSLLADFLAKRRGKKVSIKVPQRGPRRGLLAMAERNAELALQQRFRLMAPSGKAVAEELANVLGLEQELRRIECFDISHIQGSDSVASMVVWQDGRMKKSDYRKFIIKSVAGVDDFKSIAEVVGRRYRRVLLEQTPLPGLVLIDGGLGQLHAAAQALAELELVTQPLASIAKKEEILYVYGNESEPVLLPKDSPALHLIQQIRDETHRFAITFHRARRGKRTLTSELLSIPGIGQKTSRRLLEELGSVKAVQSATPQQLARAINGTLARRVYEHFHPHPAPRQKARRQSLNTRQ